MFDAETSGEAQLEQLADSLGLGRDDEDWGIVNADPTRIAEFVTFFEENYNEHWCESTVGEYTDLVLESASQAIRTDSRFVPASVDNFVATAAQLVPDWLEYWRSHDFAIAPHLRQLDV